MIQSPFPYRVYLCVYYSIVVISNRDECAAEIILMNVNNSSNVERSEYLLASSCPKSLTTHPGRFRGIVCLDFVSFSKARMWWRRMGRLFCSGPAKNPYTWIVSKDAPHVYQPRYFKEINFIEERLQNPKMLSSRHEKLRRIKRNIYQLYMSLVCH